MARRLYYSIRVHRPDNIVPPAMPNVIRAGIPPVEDSGAGSWRARLRPSLAFLTFLLVLLLGSTLQAEEEKRVLVYLEGPQQAAVRRWVGELLPQGSSLLSRAKQRRARIRAGFRGLGFRFVRRRSMKAWSRKIALMMRKADAHAGLFGRIQGGKLHFVFFERGEREPSLDSKVRLIGSVKRKKRALKRALEEQLERLSPPEEEENEEDEPEQDDSDTPDTVKGDDDEEESESSSFVRNRPGSELFRVQLGVQIGGRFFDYTASPANTTNTRPFSVFGAPALAISGEVYPAATTGITVLSDIGIQAAFAQYFGLSSKTSDDRVFETNFNRIEAGLRYRLRLAPREKNPVVLYFDGQFGMLNFGFDPVDDRSREIANETATASYSFLRVGVEARLPLGSRFALRPAIGYLGPLGGGEVHDRFRDASLTGVDMALRASFEVLKGLELSTGIEYERYAATYVPVPGDTFVAGGSLDEFLFIEAGAAYVF